MIISNISHLLSLIVELDSALKLSVSTYLSHTFASRFYVVCFKSRQMLMEIRVQDHGITLDISNTVPGPSSGADFSSQSRMYVEYSFIRQLFHPFARGFWEFEPAKLLLVKLEEALSLPYLVD